jgi:PAS domain-containing protein
LKNSSEDLELIIELTPDDSLKSIIKDSKPLEEDVRRKSSFQAKLIGSSNDGIVATDEHWNVVIFNPAAEQGAPRQFNHSRRGGKSYPFRGSRQWLRDEP